MHQTSTAEVSLINRKPKINHSLSELKVFQEYTEMQQISPFFKRRHLQVKETRIFKRDLEKALKGFLLPKDDYNMIRGKAISIISIRVVAFK